MVKDKAFDMIYKTPLLGHDSRSQMINIKNEKLILYDGTAFKVAEMHESSILKYACFNTSEPISILDDSRNFNKILFEIKNTKSN